MSGFRPAAANFFIFVLTLTLITLCGCALIFLLSIKFPIISIATAFVNLFNILMFVSTSQWRRNRVGQWPGHFLSSFFFFFFALFFSSFFFFARHHRGRACRRTTPTCIIYKCRKNLKSKKKMCRSPPPPPLISFFRPGPPTFKIVPPPLVHQQSKSYLKRFSLIHNQKSILPCELSPTVCCRLHRTLPFKMILRSFEVVF